MEDRANVAYKSKADNLDTSLSARRDYNVRANTERLGRSKKEDQRAIMADIYPRKKPRAGTQSQAEIDLYHQLSRLSDEYTIVHSVKWRIANPTTQQGQGEADFIIAHATKGILVIEVKGGQFDAEAARARASAGQRQALHAIYVLREWLATDQALSRYTWPAISYGIWLPEANWRPDPAGIWFSSVVTHPDHLAAEVALDRLFAAIAPTSEMETAQRSLLGDRLSLARGIHPLLDERLRVNRAQFAAFDAGQEAVLAQLLGYERCEVIGSAGTGKTVLAFQIAAHLDEDGLRVLLLCFNQIQARWLRGHLQESRRLPMPPFAIRDLQGFAEEVARQAGMPHPVKSQPDINAEGTQRRLARDLIAVHHQLERAGKLKEVAYDAILIDEAQDMIDEIPQILKRLFWSQHPDRRFYLFDDPAQRTDLRGTMQADLGAEAQRIELRRNYRNTSTIYALMQQFNPRLRAIPFPAEGPPGRAIAFHDLRQLYPVSAVDVAERRALRAEVRRLIREEGVAQGDILVITCYGRTRSYWLRNPAHLDLGDYHLRPLNQGIRPDQIKLSTIRSAKGYESDIVILTELDGLHLTAHSARLVYTAISRARQHLIILGRDTDLRISELRRLFNIWVGTRTGDGELPEEVVD